MREPASRLKAVDAIVVNVSESAAIGVKGIAPAAYAMAFTGSVFYNLLNPDRHAGPEHFRGRRRGLEGHFHVRKATCRRRPASNDDDAERARGACSEQIV